MNSLDTLNSTSSPASADGHSRCASPDGPHHDLFGQAHAPANRSRSQAKGNRKATNGTSGQSSAISSPSEMLQSRLASRLQANWRSDGMMESPSIWKAKATPLGRPYCQLAVTVRTMNGSDYTGCPTPAARDGKDISKTTAYLSQRLRHSPSLATLLLTRGVCWAAISNAYCLAMGYPSKWNETQRRAMETLSCRKSPRSSSERSSNLSKSNDQAISRHE